MIRFLRTVVVVLVGLSSLASHEARAEEHWLEPVLEDVRSRLIAVASPTERPRLRSVRFKVATRDEASWMGVSPIAGVTQDGRLDVVIPELFITGMQQYLRATWIESGLKRPGLAERWLRAEAESILFEGRTPGVLPEDLAKLTSSERQKLAAGETNQQGTWALGLAFVVAHELGHHALGTYLGQTSDDAAMEARVDAWAARRLNEAGFTALGVAPAMAWIWALEGGEYPDTPEHTTHPRSIQRAAQTLREARPHLSLEAVFQMRGGQQSAAERAEVTAQVEQAYDGAVDALDDLATRDREERSISYLESQASEGQRPVLGAQKQLARQYWKGMGVTADRKAAVTWYRRAAQRGDASSMVMLAWAYETGSGASTDPALALFWYQRAASLGYRDGIIRAASMETRLRQKPNGPAAICVAERFGTSFWKAQGIFFKVAVNACMRSCQQDHGHSEVACADRFCDADVPETRAGFYDRTMPFTPLSLHDDYEEQVRQCAYSP